MRILNISAQKPDSTGSGVVLTELVRSFIAMGHKTSVVAGVYKEDQISLPPEADFFPVYFKTPGLPFPIVGMSDEMPYESTRYRDMDETMLEQFGRAFLHRIGEAVAQTRPDLVICHHLYYLTALVREHFPELKIYGFCHNTDLRQMIKTDLKREFIRGQIGRLDLVLAANQALLPSLTEVYGLRDDQVRIIGTGYNERVFYPRGKDLSDPRRKLLYAGKIAAKKGVVSLLKALDDLPYGSEELLVTLAGSAGNEEEYRQIRALAGRAGYEVRFTGALTQEELAKEYSKADVFVLPSFFDSLPLVIIEALACGARVVASDLPGLREWAGENGAGASVRLVPLPPLCAADEACESELEDFETHLAQAITASLEEPPAVTEIVTENLTWKKVCRRILT